MLSKFESEGSLNARTVDFETASRGLVQSAGAKISYKLSSKELMVSRQTDWVPLR